MITLKDIFRSDNVNSNFFKSNQYLNQGAKYLSIGDVTVLLNQLFDGEWSFEIVRSWTEVYQAYDKEKIQGKEDIVDQYFYVQGRLTINTYNKEGKPITIIKEDIGSNCPRKADKKGRFDYASGYKSAVSSALKGCAANLDIDVLKPEDVEMIKNFVNMKKIVTLKNKMGKEFNDKLTEFTQAKEIQPNDVLTAKYAGLFLDFLGE
jgi:hypothetical protein|nr:MAG TPA: hypothetical protein [Caudoviricetes sp.]